MKSLPLFRLIGLLAVASLGFALAAETAKETPAKAAACCAAAAKEGKACTHEPHCVEAAKAGMNCTVCGGSGPVAAAPAKK